MQAHLICLSVCNSVLHAGKSDLYCMQACLAGISDLSRQCISVLYAGMSDLSWCNIVFGHT